jgi:phosphate transport system substrate-binding protein
MHLIKRRLIAMFGIGALVSLASTSVAGPLAQHASAASYPTVLGAGSTWVQIALDQWRADIARQGFSINYQGVGSSAGREFYINNQVDFAASEIPFQPDEIPALTAEHKAYQYIPDVAGGTSLMYNIDAPDGVRINNLRLDADAAGKIFTGVITTWQNPEIEALNPGLQIEQTTIIPVVRSDGSGTSAQFSLYLQNQAPTIWNAFAAKYGCPAPCSIWPPFPGSTQQNGSDGVADFIADNQIGEGSIGYVEAGYAFARGFPVVNLENHSGHYTQPTANNVATALRHATLYSNFTQNLIGVYNAPESNAYAMSSYSYLITPTTNIDPAKGFVLGTWLIYIACAGQREAPLLGYSPLPPNLVQDVFTQEQKIAGAPKPPPITPQTCPNPTVTTSSTTGGHTGGGGSKRTGGSGTRTVTTTATPAPTASTAPTTTTTGGTGTTPTTSTSGSTQPKAIPVLTASEVQASFALAETDVKDAVTPSTAPLFLTGAILLILLFAPVLLVRRRVS